ncbi:MAG: ATP-dependent DNA helicase RecG [Candidatus Kuenenia sp.]|nr:ATP-dependent DNA helicase RecG [Candidatus Kuenenia hertensis]
MNALELLDIISIGETSKVQFKESISSPDALAAEFVAMSNSLGGLILVGVKDKTGDIIGLTYDQLRETGQLVANVATNNVLPLIYVETEVVSIEKAGEKKNILVIHVKEGISKPYKDRELRIWVKQGADKRKVTDNNELLRLFQSGGNLSADEMEVANTSTNDVNIDKLKEYTVKALEKTIEESGLSIEQIMNNIRVKKNNSLTLGGLLYFGKNPQKYKPAFCIKAISFFGNDIGGTEYRDSKDINGTIPELFEKGMSFFNSNLKWRQQGQNFNILGKPEISKLALEELLQNALVHRDYLKNAPIRLMIFDNHIEIISPGTLPNSLTVENIKSGNAVVRNNLLVSYCVNTMPYRGFGSGIKRAFKEQPNIELINDIDGEQFIVKIPRPESDN